MSYHPDLVAEIEAFCAQHDMSEVTFGRQALKDPHFVRDVRGTRRLFRPTEDKVRAFMTAYSPESADPSSGKSAENAAQVRA